MLRKQIREIRNTGAGGRMWLYLFITTTLLVLLLVGEAIAMIAGCGHFRISHSLYALMCLLGLAGFLFFAYWMLINGGRLFRALLWPAFLAAIVVQIGVLLLLVVEGIFRLAIYERVYVYTLGVGGAFALILLMLCISLPTLGETVLSRIGWFLAFLGGSVLLLALFVVISIFTVDPGLETYDSLVSPSGRRAVVLVSETHVFSGEEAEAARAAAAAEEADAGEPVYAAADEALDTARMIYGKWNIEGSEEEKSVQLHLKAYPSVLRVFYSLDRQDVPETQLLDWSGIAACNWEGDESVAHLRLIDESRKVAWTADVAF